MLAHYQCIVSIQANYNVFNTLRKVGCAQRQNY